MNPAENLAAIEEEGKQPGAKKSLREREREIEKPRGKKWAIYLTQYEVFATPTKDRFLNQLFRRVSKKKSHPNDTDVPSDWLHCC